MIAYLLVRYVRGDRVWTMRPNFSVQEISASSAGTAMPMPILRLTAIPSSRHYRARACTTNYPLSPAESPSTTNIYAISPSPYSSPLLCPLPGLPTQNPTFPYIRAFHSGTTSSGYAKTAHAFQTACSRSSALATSIKEQSHEHDQDHVLNRTTLSIDSSILPFGHFKSIQFSARLLFRRDALSQQFSPGRRTPRQLRGYRSQRRRRATSIYATTCRELDTISCTRTWVPYRPIEVHVAVN